MAAALSALHGIRELPAERSRLYYDVIMDALPDPVRRELEAGMQHSEYRTEFARKYVAEGRQAGKRVGRKAGKRAGKKVGKARRSSWLAPSSATSRRRRRLR